MAMIHFSKKTVNIQFVDIHKHYNKTDRKTYIL